MEKIIKTSHKFPIIWKEDGKKSTVEIETVHSIKFFNNKEEIESLKTIIDNRLKIIMIEFGQDEDHEFLLENPMYDPDEPTLSMIYYCEKINITIIGENTAFNEIFQTIGTLYLKYLMEMGIAKEIMQFSVVGGKKAEKMLMERQFPVKIIFDEEKLVTMGLVVLDECDISEYDPNEYYDESNGK